MGGGGEMRRACVRMTCDPVGSLEVEVLGKVRVEPGRGSSSKEPENREV